MDRTDGPSREPRAGGDPRNGVVERTVPTVERLTRRADFLAAAGGRRFHTERLTAQGLLRPGTLPHGLRIGLTVTKRVGHATERSRIKRRLRSVIARAASDLPGLAADVVLVVRRPSLHAPFDDLVQDLRRAVDAVTKPRGEAATQKRPPRAAKALCGVARPPSPANSCDGSTDG
ncbi:ribonuclease P protein component [Methylobacterium sp.]|uniref:ribonuclease P protein component n=1 Tax=Methylobacterium sp. TaxID=409 RepID=UPI0025F93309|nr:ribonuclease P protein component [Methylobacterium sp.]